MCTEVRTASRDAARGDERGSESIPILSGLCSTVSWHVIALQGSNGEVIMLEPSTYPGFILIGDATGPLRYLACLDGSQRAFCAP